MNDTSWQVWTLWTDLSEILVTVTATDADAAIETAVRMGLVSGLGSSRRYLGLQAVAA